MMEKEERAVRRSKRRKNEEHFLVSLTKSEASTVEKKGGGGVDCMSSGINHRREAREKFHVSHSMEVRDESGRGKKAWLVVGGKGRCCRSSRE